MKLRVLEILPHCLINELNILCCANGLNVLARRVVTSDSDTLSIYSEKKNIKNNEYISKFSRNIEEKKHSFGK